MKKVLILEDDEMLRLGLVHVLEAKGLEVTGVGMVSDALRILETAHNFDLVISDWELPDGTSVGFVLTAKQKQPRAKILAMSGYIHPEWREDMILAGADVFLHKPFSAESFLAVLRGWGIIE